MNLPDELKQAAQAMGQALHEHETVQNFLAAQARLQANPEANNLDVRFQAMYQNLIERQRAGEALPPAEIEEFRALRDQTEHTSLISERDAALQVVKNYFIIVGDSFSHRLGVDYPALASAT